MFADDINAACADEFGEPATLRREGRPDAVVTGIFDSRHYQAETGDGRVVSSLETTLAMVDADTGDVPVGTEVEVRGLWRRVIDRRPDGQGITILVLETIPT